MPVFDPNRYDLPVRRSFDELEARSEQAHAAGDGFKVVYTETARQSLADGLLRINDPEAYRAVAAQRERAWEESWPALERFSPSRLDLSLSTDIPYSLYGSISLCRVLGQDGVASNVAGLRVLIESPAAAGDFFCAFTITSAAQVLKSIAAITEEYDANLAALMGLSAQRAAERGEPQVVQRLLVVPDDMKLDSTEKLTSLARLFMESKLVPGTAAGMALHWHDVDLEIKERETARPLWERTLNRVLAAAFRWVMQRSMRAEQRKFERAARAAGREPDELRAEAKAKALARTPFLALIEGGFLQNLVKMNPLKPEHKLRCFLNLDPDLD